jgi:hypothetical protein
MGLDAAGGIIADWPDGDQRGAGFGRSAGFHAVRNLSCRKKKYLVNTQWIHLMLSQESLCHQCYDWRQSGCVVSPLRHHSVHDQLTPSSQEICSDPFIFVR